MNSSFCILDVHVCPNKNGPLVNFFYSNTAVPCMHIVQFSSMKFRFQMLIKFFVIHVGSFMSELFLTVFLAAFS